MNLMLILGTVYQGTFFFALLWTRALSNQCFSKIARYSPMKVFATCRVGTALSVSLAFPPASLHRNFSSKWIEHTCRGAPGLLQRTHWASLKQNTWFVRKFNSFSCNANYKGELWLTCDPSGTWSRTNLRCCLVHYSTQLYHKDVGSDVAQFLPSDCETDLLVSPNWRWSGGRIMWNLPSKTRSIEKVKFFKGLLFPLFFNKKRSWIKKYPEYRRYISGYIQWFAVRFQKSIATGPPSARFKYLRYSRHGFGLAWVLMQPTLPYSNFCYFRVFRCHFRSLCGGI